MSEKVLISNVRGPKGDKGDKGDQGVQGPKGADGANVLPADEAIRDRINDPDSATRAALATAIGAVATDPLGDVALYFDGRYPRSIEQGQSAIKKLTALRPFHNALSRSGTPVDILMIGDSITEGANLTALDPRWTDVALRALRRKFQPAGVTGGRGYVPMYYAGAGIPDQFTLSGGATLQVTYGLGLRNVFLPSSGAQVTGSFTGTGVDIFWAGGPSTGVAEYQVDSGSWTEINTVKSSIRDGYSTEVRALTPGSHTLTIRWKSGGTCVIDGVMIYNGDENSGVRLWESGHAGHRSTDYNSNTAWFNSILPVQPDLVTICLGVMDFQKAGVQANSAAAYKAAMLGIIAKVKAVCTVTPAFVLIPVWATPQTAGADTWDKYVTAQYEIAAADSAVCVFDMQQRLNPGAPSTAGGWIDTDLVHPVQAGHFFWGEALAEFVSPS